MEFLRDMHPEEIKYLVRMRGKTLADLGRDCGVTRQAMSLALTARVSQKAEKAIADFLGKQPKDIWPSRYDEAGIRLTALTARIALRSAA